MGITLTERIARVLAASDIIPDRAWATMMAVEQQHFRTQAALVLALATPVLEAAQVSRLAGEAEAAQEPPLVAAWLRRRCVLIGAAG